jgi:hypothetical protein
MLKSQDCLILLKFLANPNAKWTQRQLSIELCVSLSEVNGGIKRLIEARLLRKGKELPFLPIISAAEEFLVYGLKYFFPVKLGEYTRGIPTGIAAPIFRNKIALGNDPLPVWPYALGKTQGVALDPIHPSVPKSLHNNPDEKFYELLVLIDAIRIGRARERNMAIKMLIDRLKDDSK